MNTAAALTAATTRTQVYAVAKAAGVTLTTEIKKQLNLGGLKDFVRKALAPAPVEAITRTQVAPTVLVHVDRTGNDRRGRAATIFVDYADLTVAEVREAAKAFLLPGEHLQGDCLRKTGLEDMPHRFEFAVFA